MKRAPERIQTSSTSSSQQTGGMFALRKIPIAILQVQFQISPDPAPDPVPTPDFPFQEFPLTEVVNQSQIDSSSISDTLIREKPVILREKPPRVQIYP